MEKSFDEIRKEYNSIIMAHVCHEMGCMKLFGKPDVADVEAEIHQKGVEALMEETTWMCPCDTTKGYEHWLRDKIKIEKLPEYVTYEAYTDALKHELTKQFNEEKAKHEVQS